MKQILSLFILFLLTISVSAQEVFVAKPYLQIGRNPTPQSLQVLWHAADTTAKWTVEHRNDAKSSWVKAAMPTFTTVAIKDSSPAFFRVFHATLTGLMAGTKFTYRVLKNGKEVFQAQGQAIKSVEQPYRFIAIGDIGAETPEQKALATRIFLEKPDYVVIPGDIVYENGLVSQYKTKFWPIYNADKADTAGAPIMRSIPFVAAVGNHDADTRNLDFKPDALAYYMFWDQPLNGPLGKEGGAFVPVLNGSDAHKKVFYDAAGETYPRMSNYSFDYGNAHWTVLDADVYVDWTNQELTDWVAKDLADSKNATWHFVTFHHPGFNSSREHFEQQQMRLLSPIFEAGKVDVVFNGHVHNYQRSFPMTFAPDRQGTLLIGGRDQKTLRGRVVNGKWVLDKTFDGKNDTTPQGIIYIVTGAGGQDLYNPEQQNDPDSWQKFTNKFISTIHSLTVADVDGKTLIVRQLDAEGHELDGFKITKE